MNVSLSNLRVAPVPLDLRPPAGVPSPTYEDENADESAHLRRLRSLLSLFALYAAALLFVILFSEGADIGCILAGIAGHVLWASGKTALAWREASWLDEARQRVSRRRIERATA